MAEENVEGFFVTGTDTNVGKTIVSAWLVGQLDGCYWKPVQAGTRPETDSDIVRRLARVLPERILPEAYVLSEPIAPHEAARRESAERVFGTSHGTTSNFAGNATYRGEAVL